MDSWASLSYVRMYAAVLAMSALGISLYLALDLAERSLCRWQRAR